MRPDTHYPWATTDGLTQALIKNGVTKTLVNKKEPVEVFKDTGITYGLGMPIQYWNYQMHGVHAWIKHLDERYSTGDVVAEASGGSATEVSSRLGGTWELLGTEGNLSYYWKVGGGVTEPEDPETEVFNYLLGNSGYSVSGSVRFTRTGTNVLVEFIDAVFYNNNLLYADIPRSEFPESMWPAWAYGDVQDPTFPWRRVAFSLQFATDIVRLSVQSPQDDGVPVNFTLNYSTT